MDPWRTFVWGIVQGSLLASSLWLGLRAKRTGLSLTQPGHWLLMLNATLIPVTLVAHTFFSFQLYRFGDTPPSWVNLVDNSVYLCFYAGLSLAWFIPIFRMRRRSDRSWMPAIIVQLLMAGTSFVAYLFVVFNGFATLGMLLLPLQVAAVLTIIAAAIADLGFRIRRDWLHWYGVIVSLFAFAANPILDALSAIEKTSVG